MDRPLTGSGLGLRRDLIEELSCFEPQSIGPHFLEIAPENWLNTRGKEARSLDHFAERYPLAAHGLCLNLGGKKPLDVDFLLQIKKFLRKYDIACYSDHLTYCADKGHLYELFPLPFTEETVQRVAHRIKQAQDILEQPIAIENASYYCIIEQELTEVEFINGIIAQSGCHLMLDINNIFVNSKNHGYDPLLFIQQLTPGTLTYLHIAGHYQESPDLIIDTHGAAVNADVWQLLEMAYQKWGVLPTLLERDINIPPLKELLPELARIHEIQQKVSSQNSRISAPPHSSGLTVGSSGRRDASLEPASRVQDREDFSTLLSQENTLLTQLVRDPQSLVLQNALPEQAQLYADFVYDNLEDILRTGFEVLHSVTQDTDWERLVRHFIKHSVCQDPLFTGIPEAFVYHLKTLELPEQLPFLHELAHYEWTELKLAIAEEEIQITSTVVTPDFLNAKPVLSPVAILLNYQYPVQRINVNFLPTVPAPVYLIAYRNRQDVVDFLEINLVTARLFELLSTDPDLTGKEAAQQIAHEIQHEKPDVVLKGAETILRQFYELDIINYSS